MEGAWRPPTYATVCVMSFAILPMICIYVYIGWMYLSICPTAPDVIPRERGACVRITYTYGWQSCNEALGLCDTEEILSSHSHGYILSFLKGPKLQAPVTSSAFPLTGQ